MKPILSVTAIIFSLLLGASALAWFLPQVSLAQQVSPTAQLTETVAQMPPTPMVDRLAPPPTVYPPTQADSGEQEFYQRCEICHGDRGQGLTDEWRNTLGPPDNNCWSSHCHGPAYPRDFGFTFPKTVPAVIGPGVFDNFNTGLDVFNFVKLYMPYQAPRSLSDTVYWELTAYLLRANGFYSGKYPLDASSAAAIQLHPQPGAPDTGQTWQTWLPYFGIAAALLVGLFALLAARIRSRR